MSTVTTQPVIDVAKARQIYQEQIRPTLTADDKGKFVTINVKTGAYQISRDEANNIMWNLLECLNRFGENAPLFTLRVGYKSATHLGGSVHDTELENW